MGHEVIAAGFIWLKNYLILPKITPETFSTTDYISFPTFVQLLSKSSIRYKKLQLGYFDIELAGIRSENNPLLASDRILLSPGFLINIECNISHQVSGSSFWVSFFQELFDLVHRNTLLFYENSRFPLNVPWVLQEKLLSGLTYWHLNYTDIRNLLIGDLKLTYP